jgi:hypothetical protein
MKKKLFMLLLFVGASIAFTACSSENSSNGDSSVNLIGKWENFQEGGIVNGQEVLFPYEHALGCSKDNLQFLAGGIFKEYSYDNFNTPCELNLATGTWTRGGDVITISASGFTNNAEILILDATTLKVKYELFGEIMIDVYKKAAN